MQQFSCTKTGNLIYHSDCDADPDSEGYEIQKVIVV
jgi:hypothetical protein